LPPKPSPALETENQEKRLDMATIANLAESQLEEFLAAEV
jgi:hypothetical protein